MKYTIETKVARKMDDEGYTKYFIFQSIGQATETFRRLCQCRANKLSYINDIGAWYIVAPVTLTTE